MDKDKIFDAHIHFNDNYKYNASMIDHLIKNGLNNNVGGFLCASFDLQSSQRAVQIAHSYPNIVFAGVAIHPNEVQNYTFAVFDALEKLIHEDVVICVGETGLDYFYSTEHKQLQQQFFQKHLELAIKYNKVLQVHIRDHVNQYQAYYDVLKMLKKVKYHKVIIHCFSADKEIAQQFLALGCYLNIGGAVTFKNARLLQDAVSVIPLDRLLVETDAPYLAPHPFRGQLNEPKLINLTVEKIAELKNTTKNVIINATTSNAIRLFEINS